jgi:hypothetical protein
MIGIGPYQWAEINNRFRDKNRDVLIPAIIDSLNELEDYWPLTLRQLYYRLVSKLIIPNNKNSYNALSKVMVRLRRFNIVSWEVIEDRTRRVSDKRGYASTSEFLRDILKNFERYDRCLVQNQENYVEIFVEKDALARIFEDVAWPYCVRVVTIKGQSSATYVHNYSERAHKARDKGLRPVILYFGDLDPTGARIPVAFKRNLKEHHNLIIDLKVAALTPDQVIDYSLPHSIDAIKTTDPNYKWYRRNFGDIAVELDAIHPRDLEDLIKNELSRVLDIEDMVLQQDIQSQERIKLKTVKKQVEQIMRTEGLL